MSFDVHFWENICFFIFIAAVYKPIKLAFNKRLDDYAASIKKHIIEVEELHKDAKNIFDYYQAQLEDLTIKIAAMERHTEENVKTLKKKAKEQLEEQIKTRRNIHQEKLELSAKESCNKAQDAIVQKAIVLTGFYMNDVVTQGPTRADVEQLLNAAKNKSKPTIFH